MKPILIILCLAYCQNISFSVVSRARNRNDFRYHMIAATLSNTIWFLTFRQLVLGQMNLLLFLPYTVGTVLGSLSGTWVSMKIEIWLGAASDNHLNKRKEGP